MILRSKHMKPFKLYHVLLKSTEICTKVLHTNNRQQKQGNHQLKLITNFSNTRLSIHVDNAGSNCTDNDNNGDSGHNNSDENTETFKK